MNEDLRNFHRDWRVMTWKRELRVSTVKELGVAGIGLESCHKRTHWFGRENYQKGIHPKYCYLGEPKELPRSNKGNDRGEGLTMLPDFYDGWKLKREERTR